MGRDTKIQKTTRPDHCLVEYWKCLSGRQRDRERAYGKLVSQARARRHEATLKTWSRQDDNAKTLRTTRSDGPKWDRVE
eukprot:3637438-Pyramimonas_sp.AAC.1